VQIAVLKVSFHYAQYIATALLHEVRYYLRQHHHVGQSHPSLPQHRSQHVHRSLLKESWIRKFCPFEGHHQFLSRIPGRGQLSLGLIPAPSNTGRGLTISNLNMHALSPRPREGSIHQHTVPAECNPQLGQNLLAQRRNRRVSTHHPTIQC